MTRTAGAILLLSAGVLFAQVPFEQNGYVEYRGFGFPDTRYNDSAHYIGEAIIHYDVAFGLAPGWKLHGATETRSDTHRQTEREFRLNIDDRGIKRPNFSIRRVSLQYNRGPLTIEVGKQLIPWGTTAILAPTDRFTPRDYLTVIDTEPLAVNAARIELKRASNTLEFVAQPLFTPSRIPLLNQRWTPLPARFQNFRLNDQGSRLPGGTQWGARWKYTARKWETTLSVFDGFNHLPLLQQRLAGGELTFQRFFPTMRMYGADIKIPFRKVTFKSELAAFTSTTPSQDDYVLYVMQVEQKTPRWSWTAGYAGEEITARRTRINFAPDRALARGFHARAAYDLTKARNIATETAAGQNGLWLRTEYRESWGPRWSGKVGFTLVRGEPTDFFGQYRRNSFFNLSLRYSFN